MKSAQGENAQSVLPITLLSSPFFSFIAAGNASASMDRSAAKSIGITIGR